MVEIEKESALTVSVNFSMSDNDYKVLYTCYLPIVGSDGIALYGYLLSVGQSNLPFIFGEDLYSFTGLNEATATIARKRLEAACLLETYNKVGLKEDSSSFVLKLFPPLSPKKFFSDLALTKVLEILIGSKKLDELKRSYIKGENIDDQYTNVSASFGSIFDIKKLDISSNDSPDKLEDKSGKHTASNIDLATLKKAMKEGQISSKYLKNDLPNILSTINFYDIDVKEAVNLIERCLNSDNIFVLDKFTQLCRDRCRFASDAFADDSSDPTYKGNMRNAEIFEAQDKLSIPQFVSARLNLSSVPEPVLDDLYKLQNEFGFSNGVVNNIVDFCLLKNGSLPNLKYMERVSMTVATKKPKTAYECSIILKNENKKFKKNVDKKIAYETGLTTKIKNIVNAEDEAVKEETKAEKIEEFDDTEKDLIASLMKGE